jgi:hypothetical protein
LITLEVSFTFVRAIVYFVFHSQQRSEFFHGDFLELIHGSETDDLYKQLREVYTYVRSHNALLLARGVAVDLTKFLPYIYERFGHQVVAFTFLTACD